jgi:cyclopropane fatty-acyl-phospholipid synthase-like methyltransferase
MVESTVYLHRCKRFLMKLRRQAYGLRLYLPGLGERHRLEAMVGPLGFWNELQNYQLNILKTHGLKKHHTLLDIGCGPLQGGVAFINFLDKGGYTGLDISSRNLEAAYTQIAKNSLQGKNPRLIHSDCLGETELGNTRYDFIFASQILYYFDAKSIRNLFKIISKRLSGDGLFLGDVIGPKHYENKYPETGYYIHDLSFVSEIAKSIDLEMTDGGEIEKYGYPHRLSLRTNRLVVLKKPNTKGAALNIPRQDGQRPGP